MLNFLPQKNKKSVVYEYILRITSFLLIFVFVVLIFLICFLTPSYFFAKYKDKVVSDQLDATISASVDNKDISLTTIKDTNAIINILASTDTLLIKRSDLIKTLIDNRGVGIHLTNFSFSNASDGSLNLTINGVADARDNLINFEKTLQKNGTFSSINLPISNIIKDVKSDFVIILKYTKK
jgi:hypothetical protein